MNPHPLTLEYLAQVALRPGMYMQDFDLRELELQLFGFDAGLAAAGNIGNCDRFNRAFSDFLLANTELRCSRGWAAAILEKYGKGESTFNEFLALLEKAVSKSAGSFQGSSDEA